MLVQYSGLALQRDAKAFNGGITELAKRLGKSPIGLANSLDPNHETQPPSFSTIINMIDLTQEKRAVFEICQLVNQIPMDMDMSGNDMSDEGQVKHFLSLVATASACLNKGSEHLSNDGKYDAFERKELAPLLLALNQVTASLYKRFSE
ncbi:MULTISPECIES: phage regulatory CII family protein [Nitrosomonas]|uniref:Phage regulatory protein CII (CP76) n=1 Tax=Nitrosomonas communis TaxID=44574 RepID=A0A0F7KFD7_9PROT|nr:MULTISPECIES: phage regulatory CII family protein [Nitrosomonas]AKH39170.1 hypothetical protein AAW31_17240 [Nitrosomonas communis]TYP69925.1 hypothetical protein BCL69_11331 [Nitrosomonas communis]UVS61349.1 hypothetical protein NX761_18050 [Nitrosomonas sp. PLL12]